jgi:membrane associated rhomboid family serine protease
VILPLTHEDMAARRWPVATISIIALCVACFVALAATDGGRREQVVAAAERAVAYWQQHPYLHLQPPLDRLAARARVRPSPGSEAPSSEPDDLEAEQRYLDARCADFAHAVEDSPTQQWGWVPASRNWIGLFTGQFLHGGVLHLLFNMWFLWLCGCNLEDRWGRVVFTGFYLSAGVAAGLAHFASAPDSVLPVIGASGAIAGAMGAFLVSFARTRIRFFYFLFVRYGTFTAPAFVMLPLWLGQELLSGLLWSARDGVAHWAHVGGFAYGLAFAFALRATGIEARLDQAVEATVSVVQDPRIMRAADLTTAGRAADAVAMLDVVAAENPDDVDGRLEMLRAAKLAGDRAREGPAYAALVRLYLSQRAVDTAYDLFAEACEAGLDASISTAVRKQLGDVFAAAGKGERAWALYASITRDGLSDEHAVRAALAQVSLARGGGRAEERRRLLEAILESPLSSAEIDERARAELAAMQM